MATAAHGQHKPRAGSESDTCLHVPDGLGPKNMGRATRRQSRAAAPFRMHWSYAHRQPSSRPKLYEFNLVNAVDLAGVEFALPNSYAG